MNTTRSDDLAFLESINQDHSRLMAPVILYVAFLLLIGALGNPLAIYIYGFRWQNSTTRHFLLWLAVLDLTNTLVTIPFEIYNMVHFYYFPNAALCRLSRFITYVINNTTAAVFIAIAVDRYLRICKPHRSPCSLISAKCACIACLCVGVAVSSPALYLYGNKQVQLPRGASSAAGTVEGVICEVRTEMMEKPWPIAFFGYLWTAVVLIFLVLCILYTLIGKVMLERRRAKKTRKKEKELRRQSSKKNGCGDEHEEPILKNGSARGSIQGSNNSMLNGRGSIQGSNNSMLNGSVNGGATLDVPKMAMELIALDEGVTQTDMSVLSVDESSTCGRTRCGSFSTAKKRRPPKSTLMLFGITAVFLVSFIPFLIIAFIRQMYGMDFYKSLSPGQKVAISILFRSYLVNNVANPIVYGMCNEQFKAEVTKLLHLPKRRPPSLSSRNESNHASMVDDLQ